MSRLGLPTLTQQMLDCDPTQQMCAPWVCNCGTLGLAVRTSAMFRVMLHSRDLVWIQVGDAAAALQSIGLTLWLVIISMKATLTWALALYQLCQAGASPPSSRQPGEAAQVDLYATPYGTNS